MRKPLRCLLVDDEAPARKELGQLLSAYTGFAVVGEAEGVETALKLTAELKPDVVFLDVKLRGETGFDYVAQVEEPTPHIVFVTAYDRYAIRGFECNAIDYLLKPVSEERLSETLRRVLRQDPLRQRASKDDTVFVKIGTTARFVPWREVSCILSEGNYTRVFLQDDPSILVLRPLHEWMALAPEGLFIRVHRTSLVRRTAIQEIRNEVSGKRIIVMTDGQILPVGRAYWNNLKATLTSDSSGSKL